MSLEKISDHNKIIYEVAKKLLKSAGLFRKGQSRIWLDDHGWFTTIFEYQPSSYSKGTYLNIGINFHWYRNDYFSFDFGYRENGFVLFKNANQFSEEVINLTDIGLKKVAEYRKFKSLKFAKEKILQYRFSSDDLWGNYHRALICFLSNDIDKGISYLERILNIESEIPFIRELKENAKILINNSEDQQLLRTHIIEIIKVARANKKLPVIELIDV